MSAAAEGDSPPPPPSSAPVVPFGASWTKETFSMERSCLARRMVWTKDGKGGKTVLFIVSQSIRDAVRVVDPDTCECLRSKTFNNLAYSACAFELADRTPVVAVGARHGEILVLHVATLETHLSVFSSMGVTLLAVCAVPSGNHVLVSSVRDTTDVSVWDVGETMEKLATVCEFFGGRCVPTASTLDVVADADRVLVLSGYVNGAVFVSDGKSGAAVGGQPIMRHDDEVYSAMFLPRVGTDEPLRAMSGSIDSVIRVWAVSDGAVLFEKSAWYPHRAISVLALTSEGVQVPAVISSDLETFYLWQADSADGECCEVQDSSGAWYAFPAITSTPDEVPLMAFARQNYVDIHKPVMRRTKSARKRDPPDIDVAEDKRARSAGAGAAADAK